MLKVFVFVLCVAGASARVLDKQLSFDPESYLRSAKEQLATNLQRICEERSEIQIRGTINKLAECAEKIEIDSRTVCRVLQTDAPRCLQHVAKFVDDCLPQRSHGVPDLVLSTMNATVNYMCRTDVEHLFELVANPCVYNAPSDEFMQCAERIIRKLQSSDETPTKEELCEAITALKPCFLSHVDDSCSNVITREAFAEVYNAGLKPCTRINSNSSNRVGDIELIYMILDFRPAKMPDRTSG